MHIHKKNIRFEIDSNLFQIAILKKKNLKTQKTCIFDIVVRTKLYAFSVCLGLFGFFEKNLHLQATLYCLHKKCPIFY